MISRWQWGGVLVLALVACDSPPRGAPPPPPDRGMRMPPPAWSRGRWVTSRTVASRISALIPGAASAMLGRALDISAEMVRGPTGECSSPSFRETLQPSDSVSHSYNFSRAELRLPDPATTTLDVLCDGGAWDAFGGRILAIAPDTILVPWDGVLFVLGRE